VTSHPRRSGVESGRNKKRPGSAETLRGRQQEVSPDATPTLLLAEAARIQREAVRDKSYRAFPIGSEVRRFLQAKRIERHVSPATIESYEGVLAKFALRHADFESLEPFAHPQEGPSLIIEFLDHYWGDADEATMKHRMSVLGSFFEWAYRTDRISANPMGRVQRPRKRKVGAARPRVPEPHVALLVSAAPTLRDQAGLLLLGRLALRKNDLRELQLGDVDLGRDEIFLRHAKGGKEHVLPLAFPDVRETLYLHLQERGGRPDEYLIYPKSNRTRPMSPAGIDQWFGRMVEAAGLAGYTMHQLRHAAIDQVRRDRATSKSHGCSRDTRTSRSRRSTCIQRLTTCEPSSNGWGKAVSSWASLGKRARTPRLDITSVTVR
jgi:site-specific recombinase XerD